MFFHDMNSFMAMEKRGYIKITLMMIQLRYHSDLHRILGDDGLKKLYKQIGDSINSATRTEDSSYFLDDGSYLLVTISDKNGGSDIVKERLRSAVQQISISSEYQKYDLAVNIRIGIAEDDENCHNVMDLLQRARKDMECDV
jgi:GGDEF domain-containing protein